MQRLSRRTLRSIAQQTSNEFRIILVCNKSPGGIQDLPNLTVIEEPFPLPERTTTARMTDKWSKVKRGLIAAREQGAGYIMICDADDCVSRRLAAFCNAALPCSGWSFDRAFVHDENSRWLFLRDNFSQLCGTSAIVWAELHDLPQSMEQRIDDFFLLCHGHGVISDYMVKVGRPLVSLPFPGAVYCTGTGENDSGFRFANWRSRRLALQKLWKSRYLSKRRIAEFGLFPLECFGDSE